MADIPLRPDSLEVKLDTCAPTRILLRWGRRDGATGMRQITPKLTGNISHLIARFTLLREIDFHGNDLEGNIPPEIGLLLSLTRLEMGYNRLSGPIPNELSQLRNLEILDLRHNQLVESIPSELGQLTGLRVLELRHNQLVGIIPPQLGQLTRLRQMYLDNNQLVGCIPPQLGQLAGLSEMGLRHNQLRGEIPRELGQLTALQLIFLNDNQLTGPIPSELGQLTGLVQMNVRNSTMVNAIPQEIEHLNWAYLAGSYDNSDHMALFLALNHPRLNVLSPEEVDFTPDGRRNFNRELKQESGWRLWFPLNRFLARGEPMEQVIDWTEIAPESVNAILIVAQKWLDGAECSQSGGLSMLHVMAHFVVDRESLPADIKVNSNMTLWQSYHSTPLEIAVKRRKQLERSPSCVQAMLERARRVEQQMQQTLLDLVTEQVAEQARVQMTYKDEDALLLSHLKRTLMASDASTLVACIARVICVLEGDEANSTQMASHSIQLLSAAMTLHWSGLKSTDEIYRVRVWNLLPFFTKMQYQFYPASISQLLWKEALKCLVHKRSLLLNHCRGEYVRLRNWCESPPLPEQGTWLHDVDLGSQLLSPEAANKLMPIGPLVTEMSSGHHAVISYKGMHFKCVQDSHPESAILMPALPGVEFMVDRLAKRVVGHGTAPARLIKITRGERQIIMQASRSVKGRTLEWVLEKQPQLVASFHGKNVADLVLLSLLTNPQDGKPDNFMVEFDLDETPEGGRAGKSLHLVGIDNDMAFGEPVLNRKAEGTKFHTEVRNVIYLLPAMDKPIDPASREHFLSLAADIVLLDWLSMLEQRNQQYQAMRDEGIFTQIDFKGDPRHSGEEGLQLPICVPQFTATRLLTTILRIQEVLRQKANATLHEIVDHVEPDLAAIYGNLRQLDKPIVELMLEIYRNSLPDQLQCHNGSKHKMYTFMVYQANKKKRQGLIKLTMAQAVVELLLKLTPDRIDLLLDGQVLSNKQMPVPLPDPTKLMHEMLSNKKLTCKLLEFLIERGVDLHQASDMNGYYPIHLAVRFPTPWVVELVRALVSAGSPVDKKSERGSVKDVMKRHITDEFIWCQVSEICRGI